MPELPEVETVVRDLRPLLIGRRVEGLILGNQVLRRGWITGSESLLRKAAVRGIDRRGKWILLRLLHGATLVIHLGMTGQLRVHDAGEPIDSHTHLRLLLDNGGELRFRDPRRFGSVSLHADDTSLCELLESLGPEPSDLEKTYWRESLGRAKRPIKAALLDQRLVAGIGNIYADESLHEAKLHPVRLASQLSIGERDSLRRAINKVIRRAIERRGSSIRDYVGGSGLKGSYQDEFRVYGRTGQPCLRCGAAIQSIRLAGRSTHYCPTCQKI